LVGQIGYEPLRHPLREINTGAVNLSEKFPNAEEKYTVIIIRKKIDWSVISENFGNISLGTDFNEISRGEVNV